MNKTITYIAISILILLQYGATLAHGFDTIVIREYQGYEKTLSERKESLGSFYWHYYSYLLSIKSVYVDRDGEVHGDNGVYYSSSYIPSGGENVLYLGMKPGNGYTDDQYKSARLIVHISKMANSGLDIVYERSKNKIEQEKIYEVDWRSFLSKEKKVVKCFHPYTYHLSDTVSTGFSSCFGIKGGGYANVKVPSIDDILHWKQSYTDREIVNRLSLVNFESGFDPQSKRESCSFTDSEGRRSSCDAGYVQINQIHKPKELSWKERDTQERMSIANSLAWMKNREKSMLERFCERYYNQPNYSERIGAGEKAVIACLYRVHNSNNEIGSARARYQIVVRDFYMKYFGLQ